MWDFQYTRMPSTSSGPNRANRALREATDGSVLFSGNFIISAVGDGVRTLGTGAGRESESPDAIKLSLARELHALGDTEGARSLVEEVAAESTGELKAQARQLLAKLD